MKLANMHFMHMVSQRNGLAAQRIYRERFLDRNQPDHRTFKRLHLELSKNGSLHASRLHTGIGRYCRILAMEESILKAVQNYPSTGLRVLGRALGVSHATVLRILPEDTMHLNH